MVTGTILSVTLGGLERCSWWWAVAWIWPGKSAVTESWRDLAGCVRACLIRFCAHASSWMGFDDFPRLHFVDSTLSPDAFQAG